MALASQAAPTPAPVPSSPIRPPAYPAASTAKNRPTPGRHADARPGPASSLLSANPASRAPPQARVTSTGTSIGREEPSTMVMIVSLPGDGRSDPEGDTSRGGVMIALMSLTDHNLPGSLKSIEMILEPCNAERGRPNNFGCDHYDCPLLPGLPDSSEAIPAIRGGEIPMRGLRILAARGSACATAVLLCAAGTVVAGSSPNAVAAATADSHSALHLSAAVAAAWTCDPDDLPGGVEGPDNDGDECSFTITGTKALPPVSNDPNSEFAVGSPALAAQCNKGKFAYAEAMGHAALAGFSTGLTPTASSWLSHFLGGTGTRQDMKDGSVLSNEAKTDPQFLAMDKTVQAAAKALLDSGEQTVDVSSSLHTVDFSSSSSNLDLQGAFGGTQGVDVSGSGYLENGSYVGTITYTIRDVYGFYAKSKFLGVGPLMHYLQGVCGAPSYPGGAHWFYDSVTVTVPFNQPAQ